MATLSTLVITNRPMFIDWWTWSITKQTRLPDEVIIATNLEGTKQELDDFEDVIQHCLNKIKRVVLLRFPKKTSLGELREAVLQKSRGAIINYIDDDDWYHPWLFADFVRGIEEKKLSLVGAPGHRRLILEQMVLFELGEIIDLIHLPFCAIKGDLARAIRFAPVSINEDMWWLETVSNFIQDKRDATEIDFPIICMIHSHNTWNSPDKIMHELEMELTGRKFPKKAPWGVSDSEWKMTHQKLDALRASLGFEKAY